MWLRKDLKRPFSRTLSYSVAHHKRSEPHQLAQVLVVHPAANQIRRRSFFCNSVDLSHKWLHFLLTDKSVTSAGLGFEAPRCGLDASDSNIHARVVALEKKHLRFGPITEFKTELLECLSEAFLRFK